MIAAMSTRNLKMLINASAPEKDQHVPPAFVEASIAPTNMKKALLDLDRFE